MVQALIDDTNQELTRLHILTSGRAEVAAPIGAGAWWQIRMRVDEVVRMRVRDQCADCIRSFAAAPFTPYSAFQRKQRRLQNSADQNSS